MCALYVNAHSGHYKNEIPPIKVHENGVGTEKILA